MCLTKVYYNTYLDGAQDITEKRYPCRDGRGCSHPEVRKYDRKFPFTKLGDAQPESHRSLSERKPTPYFSAHTPRGSKSPSPSGRRDSGVYMSGANPNKYYDYRDAYGSYDPYGYHHSSSRQDSRDRYDRDRESRLKRSSTAPQIVYMDRDGKSSSRSRSHSSSRDYSRDIPVGLVPLADEYGRRRHSSSRSRSREGHSSREGSDYNHGHSGLYYTHGGSSSSHGRRRTDDPLGYMLIDDQDERRRQRRAERRMSTSSYNEASTMAGAYDQHRYMPRRASTVVHRSDGSISTSAGGIAGSSGRPKQLRWEDQVRAQRERQNAEIASRPGLSSSGSGGEQPTKGILKNGGDLLSFSSSSSSSKGKGKGREVDDIAELRRAVERMEIPRGRDRAPRGRDEWERAGGRYDEEPDRERRKRSKGYSDNWYGY